MAAGVTVAHSALPAFAEFLEGRLAPQLGAAPAVRELGIDAALSPAAATTELVEMIERAGPFGAGTLPRFAFTGVRVSYAQPVGDGHVRCSLVGAGGGRSRPSPSAPPRARSARPCSIRRAPSCMLPAPAHRPLREAAKQSALQIDDAAVGTASILA